MTTAIIIGGGIAGCSTAYALAQRGIAVTLIEQHSALAQEASGNPLAMLYPKLSAMPTAAGDLAFAGFLHTLALLKKLSPTPTFYQQCGLLQLAFDAREYARQQQLIKNPTFSQHVQALHAAAASQVAGVALTQDCLYFAQAGWVKPQPFCQALINADNIEIILTHQAVSLQKQADQWLASTQAQGEWLADIIVLCNANAVTQLSYTAQLPLAPVRGQLNFFAENAASQALNTIICSNHFLSPAVDGIHSFGTTYAPNDLNPDLSAMDTQQNLAALKTLSPSIYSSIEPSQMSGRVGWRSATPDYLSLAGQLIDHEKLVKTPPRYNTKPQDLPWLEGLYVNAGHGSKGMITAPICAELIANLIANTSLNLPKSLSAKLNPSRFLLREMGLKQLANHLY